ncbi:MAG: hypothetical protein ACE5IR_20400 [bacterium]
MKKKTAHTIFIWLFAMMLAVACSSNDASESGNKSGKKSAGSSSLAGTWVATELSYASKKKPTRTRDIKEMMKASITMTIKASGHYSYKVKMMGMTKTESGRVKKNGNRITTDNPDFKMSLSGNRLIMTSDNHKWDFGRGKEPAISKAVFVRK